MACCGGGEAEGGNKVSSVEADSGEDKKDYGETFWL